MQSSVEIINERHEYWTVREKGSSVSTTQKMKILEKLPDKKPNHVLYTFLKRQNIELKAQEAIL